jgi:hypothetical protein
MDRPLIAPGDPDWEDLERRCPRVDLVILEEAPPALRHRVFRDGILLVERDERHRVAFETRAIGGSGSSANGKEFQNYALRVRIGLESRTAGLTDRIPDATLLL